ncbi:drebrin-like protein B [Ischnura elegans]|uniref:drebrin-like protein B n=1 Tax=Ischnura elegans TaxID=197161 RepID=UPI001ED89E48|nr:drebrin-like protein B [Ischnura elegans]
MAINLSKNRDTLLSAWKEVVDDKCATNWALFGYEGQTNDLKVVSKGDGGIGEMIDDLNSGKIMYAFCKVIDPKTSLPKCVLINWQGEGAPLVRKGTCANHVSDVSRFFIGAHLTLNARTEEEVDPDIIMEKVSKSTGSAYSFKERSDSSNVPIDCGPVGTTYKRVIPTQEINSKERDMFWEKEEMEEKRRQAEERKRKEEERKKLEEERNQREMEEAQQREQKIKERSRNIVQLREAERNAEGGQDREAERISREWERDIEESEQDERERKARSELLRRQRSHEAQSVISKRTIDARAIFEQNTSAGQMQSRVSRHHLMSNSNVQHLPPLSSSSSFDSAPHINIPGEQPSAAAGVQQRKASLPTWPPSESLVDEVSPKSPKAKKQWSPLMEVTPLEPTLETREVEGASTTDLTQEHVQETNVLAKSPSPQHLLVQSTSPQGTSAEESSPSGSQESQVAVGSEEVIARVAADGQEAEEQFSNGVIEDAVAYSEADYGRTARALYDYQAADSTEISFDPGEIITNIDQIDEGWWQGIGPDGTFGLFPANYVELLN